MHKTETIKTIENYILNSKCIYIKGTKVVGNSKVSSGPLLMEVEKRMPKVRVDEGSGVRSTEALISAVCSTNFSNCGSSNTGKRGASFTFSTTLFTTDLVRKLGAASPESSCGAVIESSEENS